MEYLKNFKWNFRIGGVAYFENSKIFQTIEIDPGGGCMESRDIERWKHIGFGFYKCYRKNITIWLDKESDYSIFEVRGFLN